MKDMTTAAIFGAIFRVIITFGLVCLGVLLFSIQFMFDWSFLLCVCIWMCLMAGRWMFGRDE